jgi:hypothetical protein
VAPAHGTLISSVDPAIAFIGFLQTMQALPKRPLSQPYVFVSHRVADVPYVESIALLASRKAGLDVHGPVLHLASVAFRPAIRSMPSPSSPSSRWHC